jgi:hypothetical protein
LRVVAFSDDSCLGGRPSGEEPTFLLVTFLFFGEKKGTRQQAKPAPSVTNKSKNNSTQKHPNCPQTNTYPPTCCPHHTTNTSLQSIEIPSPTPNRLTPKPFK